MKKQVFIVIEMYQGLVNDAVIFFEEMKAWKHLLDYVVDNMELDELMDLQKFKECFSEELIDWTDISGSYVHVTEIVTENLLTGLDDLESELVMQNVA